ncbi:hypothetical protein D3C71_1901150 [compost metagenome]
MFQPPVGHMYDLVDGERSGRALGVSLVVGGQLLGDHCQPFVQLAFGPRIQRRESADDTRLALRQRQLRMRNNE